MKPRGAETAGVSASARSLVAGIPDELPEHPGHNPEIDHAPPRRQVLSAKEKELALANALRYFPPSLHERLAPTFADELARLARLYIQRYRPAPADGVEDAPLTAAERAESARLLRVNRAGEIAAQALYSAQAVFAREDATREQLRQAAREERDHLAW